jgi:hypothetical protein
LIEGFPTRLHPVSHTFEMLVARFALTQKRYAEAQTHDEKVQLALIAKEIAEEARKEISGRKYGQPPAGPKRAGVEKCRTRGTG